MQPISEGIIAGLWLSILVGPLLVIIIQNTLSKGITHGYWTVAGIWLSDLLFLSLSYLLLSRITAIQQSAFFTEWIGLFGGIIVLIIGIGILLAKPKPLNFEGPVPNKNIDALKSLAQGFSVNTFNPFTITFWTGAASLSIARGGWTTQDDVLYLVTILVMIMITDSLKVYFANIIRKKMNLNYIIYINKGAGVLVSIIGIVLIFRYLNL